MKRSRQFVAVAAALACATAVGACGSGASGSGSGGTELTPMKFIINFTPSGEQADLYYGKQLGLFEKQGIDLQILPGTTSQDAIAAVLAGRADVGTAGVKDLIQSGARGQKALAIGNRFGETSQGVFVPRSSPIRTLEDLEGKTVLVADSQLQKLAEGTMRKNGVDPSKVHFVIVSSSALVGSYVNGQGDALLTSIPLAQAAVTEKRPGRIINLARYGLEVPAYAYFTSPSALPAKKELMTRLLRAVYASMAAADKDPRAAAEAEVKQVPALKIDATIAEYKLYSSYECSPSAKGKSLGYMAPRDWKGAAKDFSSIGLIPSGFDPTSLFTNELVTGPDAPTAVKCPRAGARP